MRIQSFAFSAALLAALLSSVGAQASSDDLPIIEHERRQDQESRLQSFGSDLLGDQIDPATGALTFEQTDVVLPGNSHLEVAVRRRRSQGYYYRHDVQAEFGDWTLLAPRINVISGPTAWTGARCSASQDVTLPPHVAGQSGSPQIYYNRDYSEGVVLDVPGAGSQQILWPYAGLSIPQFPVGTAHVTVENWRFLCNVTANDGGEGFTGIAPNGDTYRFDRLITRPYKSLGTVGGATELARNRNYLAATLVTDVNGNTVSYTYDSFGRLTQISANDEINSIERRVITISYQGASQLVHQVTANGRTWTYTYAASTWNGIDELDEENPAQSAQLATVTLPNSTAWTFQLDGMEGEPNGGLLCHQLGSTLTVTHPNGAMGTFQTFHKRHRQSLNLLTPYSKLCPGTPDETVPLGQPVPVYTGAAFKSLSVISKTITAPGASPATWTYGYENDAGNPINNVPPGPACVSGEPCNTNWTTVQEPNGRHLTYYHYWTAEWGVECTQSSCPNTILPPGSPLGGKLARLEVREGGPTGTLLEKTDYQYFLEGSGPEAFGKTFARTGFVAFTMTNPTRTDVVTINRNGDTFTTDNNFNTTFSSSSYSWGFPTNVTETSSTAPSLSRTTDTVYTHNTTKWVLGLPSTLTKNSKLFDSYTYDSLGRVDTHSKFGALAESFSYSAAAGQLGTVATYTDGHSPPHTWTLSEWKRGKPERIVRPGGLGTFTREVNEDGWVTKETDYRGMVFNFGYDTATGWLTLVDRPAPFNDTTISYSNLSTGIVATSTRGTKIITATHDGYLRPTHVKTEATDGSAVTNYVKTSYDGLGRTTFQSWPSTSASPVMASTRPMTRCRGR